MKKIKIGLITNNNFVDKYNYNLVKWIKKNDDKFILDHFISIKTNNKYPKKIFKKIFFKLIIFLEKFLLNFYSLHKDHFKKFNISNIVEKELNVKGNLVDNKVSFNEENIKKIKKENFDILIRSCSYILTGEILNISKNKIISFHHGNIQKFRGSPAGFWEVFFKEDETGFAIQQLDENLDAGNILFEGFFQTKFFFLLNQCEVYNKSLYYLKKILVDLFKNQEVSLLKKQEKKLGKIYEVPNIKNQIIYLINLIKNIFIKFLNRKTIWNIYYLNKKTNSEFILKNEDNKFTADPFIYRMNGSTFFFAEEFCFKKNKGYIVCYNIKNRKPENKRIILEENFHLSFPYIFKFKNDFFLCPETSAIKEIRLYKSINFPFEWEYNMTLIRNISAADSMIFEKNNLWWLITNLDTSKSNDFSHDLSIFYSKDGPLTDKWISHKKNPIFIDSRKSRNAGLIYENGEIIRISQKQGFDKYGKNIKFNKIINISPDQYYEEDSNCTDFDNLKKNLKLKNIHHLSKINDEIIFDFNNN